MDGAREKRAIIDEVEFWLGLSTSFFETFRIKKDPGPSWFLVNEVLREAASDCTVGDATAALTTAGVTRSKPVYDITQYTKQLCALGLIQVKDTDFKKRVFPVETVLKIAPGMERSVGRYVSRILEDLFGRETADLAAVLPSRSTMNKIYDFMRDTYIPSWEKFLMEVAKISVKTTKRRDTAVFGRLRGSTEVFVLLLKLWEEHLNEDIGTGYTLSGLRDMHYRTRGASPSAIEKYVDLLSDDKVLHTSGDSNSPTLYRLGDDYFFAFREFAPDFVSMREALRERLRGHILGNSDTSIPESAQS